MPKYSLLKYHLVLVVLILIGKCLGRLCVESEKQALLSFKQGLVNPNIFLSSWSDSEEECCKWRGIVCDNITGHVTQLQLGQRMLSGKITHSLLNLKHLTHLELGYDNFVHIPSFLGSLVSLTNLDLDGPFVGMIPSQIGNLSNLQHLRILNQGTLYSNNLDWLSGLRSLENLDFIRVNLSEASDNWVSAINKLSKLSSLRLLDCDLRRTHLPSHQHLNLTSIQELDLRYNPFEESPFLCIFLKNMNHLRALNLTSTFGLGNSIFSCLYNTSNLEHLDLSESGLKGIIPREISNMTSLVSLDLSLNSLQGKISPSLGKLCNLESLDLSQNNYQEKVSWVFESLSGCLSNSLSSFDISYNLISWDIPDQIAEFKNLKSLRLGNNNISGPLPVSIGSLSKLESLDISSNHLQGVVSEAHFANLTNLEYFDAHGNSLTLSVTPNWIPRFDLVSLDLSNWNLGPHFPLWLKSQKNINDVYLSNNEISDSIPSWFWNFSSHLGGVDLSHNHLHGVIPNLSSPFRLYKVDLSSNELTGSLPRISDRSMVLDLSDNLFSGELFGLLCNPPHNGNRLQVLRLGDNLLEGNIPNCWGNWPQLLMIDLRNSYLTGPIPSSIGLLNKLRSLNLGNNSLTGEIPNSLENCSKIEVVNLGRNRLVGKIPRWIGSLHYLSLVILHSNKVNGDIPKEICTLDNLRILDVSDNHLFGALPNCLNKAFGGTLEERIGPMTYVIINGKMTTENAVLVTKGKESNYKSILGLVTTIDLSRNNLSGEIPEEFASLQGLRFLNLSGNHLHGRIPNKIGSMTVLESLDLSWNNLSGQIPPSITHLSFLNFLNLSRNNFSGEIPRSTQLQSLNSSSFVGNQLLCGDPLPKQCRDNDNTSEELPENVVEEDEDWFRLGVGVGFGVGFLGIIAPLAFSRIWRQAYFWFFQDYLWCNILNCIIRIKYIIGVKERHLVNKFT